MGGAQLTGGVELTVGDKLTGGETWGDQTFNKADRGSYACIYGGKINGETNQSTINIQQVNIVQSPSGRMDTGQWTGRYLQ